MSLKTLGTIFSNFVPSNVYKIYTQFYPPSPLLTEANLPSQAGKVFIVTGGNNGVGYELCRILYHSGARVYMAARTESKAIAAIESITSLVVPKNNEEAGVGELLFLPLDLADLTTIKSTVSLFLSKEKRLDILFNNAGVSSQPTHLRSKQGHEMHMATNCLGPFLLTSLLTPLLLSTAASSSPASVRTIWTSSAIIDSISPTSGVSMEELSFPSNDVYRNYAASKAGNWLLASEMAKRVGEKGVVSLVLNPGNLKTEIWDSAPTVTQIAMRPTLSPRVFGAYTNLWAGLSADITAEDGGRYIAPWGRFFVVGRKDIYDGLKSVSEGGTGRAEEFWVWCDEQTKEFA